jgi:hypothetical protein
MAALIAALWLTTALPAAPTQVQTGPDRQEGPPAGGEGLRFKNQIDAQDVPMPGEEFRYSFCLGRRLQPNEPAAQCTPARADSRAVSGGRVASYVFSSAPGTFLPPGLTLDPYTGVLSGRTVTDLRTSYFPICVRQLNAETCSNVGVGRPGQSLAGQGGVPGQEARGQQPPRSNATQQPAGGAGTPPVTCDFAEGNRLAERLRACVAARNCPQTTVYGEYDKWCRSCNFRGYDVGTNSCVK